MAEMLAAAIDLPGVSILSEKALIQHGRPLHGSAQIKASVARALIAALSDECKAYCILSGYQQLPDSFDSDIDFMVDKEDFRRLPHIIETLSLQTDTKLFQSIEHEITGRAYLLASLSSNGVTFIQLDSASDYRHFDSLWLRSSEVLPARRWHPRGFWIPSPAHEFAYYLVKRINKSEFTPQHGSILRRLYAEDPSGCNEMIARFWRPQIQRNALIQMANSNDWSPLIADLETFHEELMRNTGESSLQKVASIPSRGLHFLGRVVRPTGGFVALMGPDGCGKSTVLNAISQQFAPAFRNIQRFHMRPYLLGRANSAKGPVTDPHGQPPRGMLASVAKVFYFAADYVFGYLLKILPALIRTRLVLFDRYMYDLLVDSKRVRYGGPHWLLRFATRFIPRPDLVVLLDAPPEVLWSRKQEVPFEEVTRQRSAYRQIAGKMRSTVIVNAELPPGEVIDRVADAIIDYFAARTARRLKLSSPHSVQTIEADLPSYKC